jgi:hypothetical protein
LLPSSPHKLLIASLIPHLLSSHPSLIIFLPSSLFTNPYLYLFPLHILSSLIPISQPTPSFPSPISSLTPLSPILSHSFHPSPSCPSPLLPYPSHVPLFSHNFFPIPSLVPVNAHPSPNSSLSPLIPRLFTFIPCISFSLYPLPSYISLKYLST